MTEQRIRILYLCPHASYRTKMARHRFQFMHAMEKLAELVWSGPGWPNYDSDLGVDANIRRLYGARPPDLVVAYPFPLKGFSELTLPKCVTYDEMHTPDGQVAPFREIHAHGADLVVCHYWNEFRLFCYQDLPKVKLVHIPLGVDPNIFKDYGEAKTIDVLLVGTIDPDLYPLRTRLMKLLPRLRQEFNCETYVPPTNRERMDLQLHLLDYARKINSAKITLTCSSKYRYALAKYVEIPLCHSVLMGDLPEDRKELFRSFVSEINLSETDEEIIGKVRRLLANEKERTHLVQEGVNAMHQFTCDAYAQRFLQAAKELLAGKTLR